MASTRIHDCKATANLQPPGPFSLTVTCKVKMNAGQKAELVPAVPQGINAKILILDLVIHGRGAEPIDQEVKYQDKNYKNQYDQVTIRYETEHCTAKVVVVQ